ncbi:Spc98 family-domain-containing protein [Naematelia encephala]|uniref:Spindle pole body component n=1 Tax=Naematelia encephala TaxID=71784 RepID=A0A1Y2B4Y9_9TREE|nr:Spc98 family-domain-containing protein [Naematelia encephala]
METHDLWLAEQEAAFTLGQRASSSSITGVSAASTPMLLLHEYENHFGFLLDHLPIYALHAHRPIVLLETIYSDITSLCATAHVDNLRTLVGIFTASAEPQWKLLGDWLHRGMPIPSALLTDETVDYALIDDERALDAEFFIKRDRDVSWADEDFWEAGFVDSEDGWPSWLSDADSRDMILEAGKARGLLKSLVGRVQVLDEWRPLQQVLKGFDGSTDISIMLAKHLAPTCQIVQFQLRRVLDDECRMDAHLEAIDGLLGMRSFDVLDDWCRALFDKMRSKSRWADPQVLTSSLRDIIEQRGDLWMNPSAIRIRLGRLTKGSSDVQSLGLCTASYQVPFPLSQLFTPTSMELRSEVFTFLLQIRHVRYTLDDIRLHLSYQTSNIRTVYRLLQKLTWTINIIWTWITDRVLEPERIKYRAQLANLTSLKSMINLELQHTRRIRDFCFGNPNMADVKEAIMSIFEIVVSLSLELSKDSDSASPSQVKQSTPGDTHVQGRSRRRKARRRKKDVESSSDEDDLNRERDGLDVLVQPIVDSDSRISWSDKIQVMEVELDGQVRYIRDSAERLASEPGQVAEFWSMLALSLEDWK